MYAYLFPWTIQNTIKEMSRVCAGQDQLLEEELKGFVLRIFKMFVEQVSDLKTLVCSPWILHAASVIAVSFRWELNVPVNGAVPRKG